MVGMEQAAAVAIVLGLLAFALWWLRRRGLAYALPGRKPPGRKLEFVERLSLGPQHSLHLVRVADRALLLSSCPTGCALIESLPWAAFEQPREVSL